MTGGTAIPRAQARPERRKRCTRCRQLLRARDFYRNRDHPDGLDYACRLCRQERKAEGEERLRHGNPRDWRPKYPAFYRLCPFCGLPCGRVKRGARRGELGRHRNGAGEWCPGAMALWMDCTQYKPGGGGRGTD